MEKVKVLCSCEGESLNDLFQEWSYQNETGKKVLDTELLGREGIELRRASVSEAFELINAGNNYGLLIIDCGTPLELVENFRLRNPNSLVAYSGFYEERKEDIERTYKGKVDIFDLSQMYLSQPQSIERVRGLIQKLKDFQEK